VEVPAKKIPYFKPSKELKDVVNVGAAGHTPASEPAGAESGSPDTSGNPA
jgi:integration host factor subunit beta